MNRSMPTLGVCCLLTLPWLNPFTYGPAPAVIPWLCSIGCAAAVLGMRAAAGRIPAMDMDRQQWLQAMAGAWLVAALMSAAIGLLQYFGTSAALAPWVSTTGLGEAYGNLRQRNQFATLMAIGLAALVWWVSQGLSWRWASAAAMLLALGCAASSSRTGLLQWLLLVGFAVQWGGLQRQGVRRTVLVAVLAYAVGTVGLPWLADLDPLNSGAWARLRSGDDACMGRMTLWSNVFHLIAQKPWMGWGWGELGYAHFVTLYPGMRFCEILDNAHNLPLHLAVELGLPVSLAVCGAGLGLVLRAKPWGEADAARQLAWAVLAVIALHSLLEYPLWYGPFQIAALWAFGLLWQRPVGIFGQSIGQSSLRLASAIAGFIATSMIAIVGFIAWDYWRVSQLYVAHAERATAYRDDTLDKLRDSRLFRNQVQFAELTTMPLTADNAAYAFHLAQQLLHFSPEPRVVEKTIESATLLGYADAANFYIVRYRAAFPEAHSQWAAPSVRHKVP